jgi:hypothetical protein
VTCFNPVLAKAKPNSVCERLSMKAFDLALNGAVTDADKARGRRLIIAGRFS